MWFESPALTSPRFLHADHQGSITAIGDAAGALIGIHTYDSWGEPRPHNPGRFQYTGQILIGELGLYHYKARFYSPKLGRFLQVDPVGYDDQVNLYAYVGNDAVNKTDPTGTCFENYCPVNLFNEEASAATKSAEAEVGRTIGETLYEGSGAKALVDAVRNPSLGNVLMAAVGLTPVRAAGTFATVALRNAHSTKHAAEFGLKSAGAYERAAGRFMTDKLDRGALQAVRKNGDVVRYNPKTNEFGVAKRDGTIRTYFKPDPKVHGEKDNLSYFRKEASR